MNGYSSLLFKVKVGFEEYVFSFIGQDLVTIPTP
jgi:hypothetical protein